MTGTVREVDCNRVAGSHFFFCLDFLMDDEKKHTLFEKTILKEDFWNKINFQNNFLDFFGKKLKKRIHNFCFFVEKESSLSIFCFVKKHVC